MTGGQNEKEKSELPSPQKNLLFQPQYNTDLSTSDNARLILNGTHLAISELKIDWTLELKHEMLMIGDRLVFMRSSLFYGHFYVENVPDYLVSGKAFSSTFPGHLLNPVSRLR